MNRISRYHARKGQRITVRFNDGTSVSGILRSWDAITVRVSTDDLRVTERAASAVWYAEAA